VRRLGEAEDHDAPDLGAVVARERPLHRAPHDVGIHAGARHVLADLLHDEDVDRRQHDSRHQPLRHHEELRVAAQEVRRRDGFDVRRLVVGVLDDRDPEATFVRSRTRDANLGSSSPNLGNPSRCSREHPACLASPIASILHRPLSTRPRKSVCGLTRASARRGRRRALRSKNESAPRWRSRRSRWSPSTTSPAPQRVLGHAVAREQVPLSCGGRAAVAAIAGTMNGLAPSASSRRRATARCGRCGGCRGNPRRRRPAPPAQRATGSRLRELGGHRGRRRPPAAVRRGLPDPDHPRRGMSALLR